jgi:TonB family protein
MGNRDHTFAIALIASLLLHAAIVFVVADDALRRVDGATGHAGRTTVQPVEEVSYVVRPPPTRSLDDLFGDARGTGDSINTRRGEQPMQSREGGQTQGFLSRDPVGMGKIDKEPSMSVLPSGSAIVSPLKGLSPPPSPPPPPAAASIVPFGAAELTEKLPVPHVTRARPRYAAPAATPSRPGAPGAEVAAADPAVMSDSESDPFSKRTDDKAVVFRDGRVEARLGRKVKTIRPHLSFASQVDLMATQFPRLVVRVHIHADGSVRRVEIVKSSGSVSADQEVKVALYEWWFEPAKDDVVEFPIVWR